MITAPHSLHFLRFRLAWVLFCLLMWGAASSLSAWDWPVKDPSLAADFASDRDGSFLPGVILKSSDALVRSIHGGELVFFVAGQRRDHRGFPGTPGGTLVIQHDGGFRSVYHNLQADSVRDFAAKVAVTEYKVRQNEIVGMMPVGSDSIPDNLFFQLIDNRYANAVNPMIVLPRLSDERPPAITAAEILVEGSTKRIPLQDRYETEQPNFQLFVQVRDGYGLKGGHAASTVGLPQRIRILLNGVVSYDSSKLALLMKSDTSRELILSRNPFGSFAAIHPADNMINVGSFTLVDGVNRLEIRATDLQGNRSSVSYRIIKPPKPAQS